VFIRLRSLNPFLLLAFGLVVIFALPLCKLFMAGGSFLKSEGIVFQLFGNPQFLNATRNSLLIAFLSTLLACSIGLIMSLFVGLVDTKHIHRWSFIILFIFFLPPTFLAISWVDVGILLHNAFHIPNPMYHPAATVILLALHLFPICFFMVLDALKRLPYNLIEAAKSCGASPLMMLRQIILPILKPALVKAAILIWFSCLGHFAFYALLGIPGRFTTLTTLIYAKLSGFGMKSMAEVVLICMFLLGIGALGTCFLKRLSRSKWQYRHQTRSLVENTFSSPQSRFWVYGLLGVICIAIFLPTLKLIMTSLTPRAAVNFSIKNLSLENYIYILQNKNVLDAVGNSLFLGLCTAAFLYIQSALFEYGALSSKKSFFTKARFFFQSLYLLPGSILAISLILLILQPFEWLNIFHLKGLYNTLTMIFIAYMMRFFAFHLNIVYSTTERLSSRLIESAKSCGARACRTLKDIFMPLVSPSLMNGSFLVFILILHEVTVSSLLPSTDTQTIGVVLLSMMENGDTRGTAALCILVMIFLIVLRMIAQYFARRAINKAYQL